MPARKRDRLRSRRAGFTLVEVLVVTGIIAVLFSILIMALIKTTGEAQRARCQNNLRQIVLGLHMFHDDHGTFPTSGGTGGVLPKFTWIDTTATAPKGGPLKIGFGDPDPNLHYIDQKGSWTYTLLPYVEKMALYEQVDYSTPIDLYVCLARRTPTSQKCPPTDPVIPGIAYDFAGMNPWSKADYQANGLIMQCWNHPVTSIGQITDGTSHTILVGEKVLDPQNYHTGGWYWDEPAFIGCNTRTGTCVFQDKVGVPFQNNWGSAHPTAAQFGFVDGSVRPIKYNTSSTIVRALLTPSGDEDVSAYGY